MSIQQEEIMLKEYATGTTLLFFSTHLDAIQDTDDIEYFPSIVELNNIGLPVDVTTFDGENLWTMNDDNIYVPTQTVTTGFLTGYSYTYDFTEYIDKARAERYKDGISQEIDYAFGSETGGTIPNHTEYVFAKYHEIDDFYVNIKLNRTFDTLDTLNIYNNLVNSIPTQEADTGVVFGRLMARQTIKDEEGNNISIPLRNVPIGVFNSSETFPDSTSTDSNGDRLYLNIKENAQSDEYFNVESFSADTSQYLRSASQFTTVPDQYKYITTTNENGEFIIYDVPIGNQVVVFEVDMFKQGLTKDEIALNFFPFPPSEDSILDTIPNFSFKQFPVSVVPAWGTIQTGYTELDITVNYDLKKWATFYVPPMGYDGNKLGSVELLNFSPSLNVDVRDMSKEGFPHKNIPVVEIQKIYDKEEDQTLLWESEFAQLKKTVKFYDHGFRAFKVPANMYDPKGYRTNVEGEPMNHPSSQGVWLAGYQFKLYYNQPSTIFRTTGFQRDWGYPTTGWRGRDHFHRNRGETSDVPNTDAEGQIYPPYDKPWTHLYPDKYKIPAKPTDLNFNKVSGSGRLPGSSPYYLEQPEYKDGDLVGKSTSRLSVDCGGYGAQYSSTNSFWFPNRFSKEVTAGYVYKYEGGVAWNETYSNGYEPSNSNFPVQPGVSKVLNGEKYQRVECGYGYWLKPEGWPVIFPEKWGDIIFWRATQPGFGLTSDFEPSILTQGLVAGSAEVKAQNIPIDVYNFEDKDLGLALDNKATYSEGALSLYRVIDPNDRVERGPEVIPTYVIYNFGQFYFQRGKNSQKTKTGHDTKNNNNQEDFFSKYNGGSAHATHDYNRLRIRIVNNGNISVEIPGTSTELAPGESDEFAATDIGLNGLSLELPGNSNFDFTSSKYTEASYGFVFKNIHHLKDDDTNYSSAIPIYDMPVGNSIVTADSTPIPYYMVTSLFNGRSQYDSDSDSCNTDNEVKPDSTLNKWIGNFKMDGTFFVPTTAESSFSLAFQPAPIVPDCGGSPGGYGTDNKLNSVPIQVI